VATTFNPAQKSGDRYGDLKRRLWFLLGALVVYRIGHPYPGARHQRERAGRAVPRQQGGILGLLNVFSGGALSRFSIFALGIMPYISASIIMQLCTVVVPSLEALKKEGEAGRRKDHAVHALCDARPGVLPGRQHLARAGSAAGTRDRAGLHVPLLSSVTLVTGTMFLMWLGEQITERGLGNGIRSSSSPASRQAAAGDRTDARAGTHGRVLVALIIGIAALVVVVTALWCSSSGRCARSW
jgi:preprotein translocase subunit SecY